MELRSNFNCLYEGKLGRLDLPLPTDIQELPEDQIDPGRLVASDQKEQDFFNQPPIAEVPSNDDRQ